MQYHQQRARALHRRAPHDGPAMAILPLYVCMHVCVHPTRLVAPVSSLGCLTPRMTVMPIAAPNATHTSLTARTSQGRK